MGAALSRANRGFPSSVVALDLDHFKSYNDTFGHMAGDEVLRTVASLLRDGIPPGGLVARTGGEEFVIVLTGIGLNEATVTAERLRIAIAEHPWPARPVTASLEVTTISQTAETSSIAEILESADKALYRSKQSGRNRVTRSHPIGARMGYSSECHQARVADAVH